MKCKLYFKNPTQYFVLDGTKEEIFNNYVKDNELDVLSVKIYGKVLKAKILCYSGQIDTVKIKSL